jgi:hypothetical protein
VLPLMSIPLRGSLKKKLTSLAEFWCELAMALGRPVGELQQTISWAEYEMWMLYRIKYGPLSPIRKYDQGAAIIAAHMNNIHGGKATPEQFIFYGKEPPDEEKSQQALMQDFIKNVLGGRVKIGKRKRR